MFHKCANDYFGYCPSPELDTEASSSSDINIPCRLDPKTCGKYQTSLQSFRSQIDKAKDILDDWPKHKNFVKLLAEVEKLEAEVEVS